MDLLREWVKSIIAEKAVLAPQAAESGLALLRSGNQLVLYTPKGVMAGLTAAMQKVEQDELYNPDTDIQSAFEESIYGYMKLSPPAFPCNGAMEVASSAAQKGYGPLLYDIAMAMSPNGLMSDRKTVSRDAQSIWKKYHDREAGVHGHVYLKPLDDIDHPRTPEKSDDCSMNRHGGDELNYSYSAQGSVNTTKFVAAHQRFVEEATRVLASQGLKAPQIESRLVQAGDQFFDIMYLEGW